MGLKLFSTTTGAGGGSITLPVSIANGGTGQTTATLAFNALSPATTKGDLLVHNGTNVARLAVGTNNQVLVPDSSQSTGVKWTDYIESFTGFIQAVTDTTVTIDNYAKYKYTITDITQNGTGGTSVLKVQISGTNVTSLNAINCSSSQATTTASGANQVNIGDNVTFTFSSTASLVNFSFTMKTTRN